MPSWIIEWLIPPAGSTPEQERDWKWRIAMSVVGLYFVVFLAAIASVGKVWGVSGFASAAEVRQSQLILNEVRLDQIRGRLDATRQRQCQAQMEGNALAMRLSFEQMQSYVNQHLSMAGYTYRIPDCGELIPYYGATLQPPTPAPTVGR